MAPLYLLHESASGYALLHAHGLDAVGASTDAVQASVTELDRFGKVRREAGGKGGGGGVPRASVGCVGRRMARRCGGRRRVPRRPPSAPSVLLVLTRASRATTYRARARRSELVVSWLLKKRRKSRQSQ